MALRAHPPILCNRCFSTTTSRSAGTAIYNHNQANRPPPYPYGPALHYKQADSGLYGGATIQFGNKVSERNEIKSRRVWRLNIHQKRLWSDALQKFVRVKVQARVLRTIDKVGGLDEYLLGDKPARVKELGMEGWALRWKVMQSRSYREKERAREAGQLGESKEGIELKRQRKAARAALEAARNVVIAEKLEKENARTRTSVQEEVERVKEEIVGDLQAAESANKGREVPVAAASEESRQTLDRLAALANESPQDLLNRAQHDIRLQRRQQKAAARLAAAQASSDAEAIDKIDTAIASDDGTNRGTASHLYRSYLAQEASALHRTAKQAEATQRQALGAAIEGAKAEQVFERRAGNPAGVRHAERAERAAKVQLARATWGRKGLAKKGAGDEQAGPPAGVPGEKWQELKRVVMAARPVGKEKSDSNVRRIERHPVVRVKTADATKADGSGTAKPEAVAAKREGLWGRLRGLLGGS